VAASGGTIASGAGAIEVIAMNAGDDAALAGARSAAGASGKIVGTNAATDATKTGSTWFLTWKQSFTNFKSWVSSKGTTEGTNLGSTGNPVVAEAVVLSK
jgi:hypothetical protein